MRGYPKTIKTKQDFLNLLNMEEFKDQALIDLTAIHDLQDSKTTKATTLIDPAAPEKGYHTKLINNPMPLWKQRGFASKQEISGLITQSGEKI
jgi:hypothetical protein